MNSKAWNWRLWVGFAASVLALFIYSSLFAVTRSIFWLSVALCVVAAWLLVVGLRHAFTQPDVYRGKVAGPILATFSALAIALFAFTSYMMPKAYPLAHHAPAVGQKAPELALTDAKGTSVRLADLFSASLPGASGVARAPRGVLLVFYRGYW